MGLSVNSTLHGGQYKIVSFISAGGFGCTYEAYDTLMETRVAIKEFFVKDYCNRDEATSKITLATQNKRELVGKLRQKFIDEARALFKMKHDNIVRVNTFFEENGTAYYVMEYVDGLSLNDILKKRGSLSESEMLGYIRQVAAALKYVHQQNRLHLDIKPGNILVDNTGKAVLIDFGASKHYDEGTGENTTTMQGLNTPGYAPYEQTVEGITEFTPASDIYALGATMYKLLTGVTPPNSGLLFLKKKTLAPLPESISSVTRNAIAAAMQLHEEDRPQSIDEFLEILENSQARSRTEGSETDDTIYDIEETQNIELSDAESIKQIAMQRYLAEKRAMEEKAAAEKKAAAKQAAIEARQAAVEAEIQRLKEEEERRQGIFNVNGVTFKMIKVEGGTFDMKEKVSSGFLGLSSKEIVQRTTLSDYYIGETQVTQALWQAVMGSNPSSFKGDRLPVESVSWDDCQKFIRKLNSITGKHFRLPTEAEWEFAARGGNYSKGYEYSGSDNLDDVAWYDGNSGKPHDVATKQANELGIYDMSGNVWEWCQDWYGDYSRSAQTNPTGPNSGSNRVFRGGSWFNFARGCRVSNRNCYAPDYRFNFLGLRLVLLP